LKDPVFFIFGDALAVVNKLDIEEVAIAGDGGGGNVGGIEEIAGIDADQEIPVVGVVFEGVFHQFIEDTFDLFLVPVKF